MTVTSLPGPAALLVLEDGTAFRGRSFGAPGEAFGEAVFATAMAGYQEVLTDPSYHRQIVAMTAPHVGNYGVNTADAESDRVQVAAFAVREASRRASSWRAEATLREYLADAGVVGIEGLDTRRLTLRLRSEGAMRAGVSTVDLDLDSLAERVRALPGMEGADLASAVSCRAPYPAAAVVDERPAAGRRTLRVAAYDFGIKRNILRLLAGAGTETTVFPATTPAREVLAGSFDGVFLSNGPGDPGATAYGERACRELLGRIPVFGICLGHQLMARALGATTYKLKFGHRGVNQPVLDRTTGRVEITTHNHGFAVEPHGWATADGDRVPTADTEHGEVAVDRWNLNDGTVEGLTCRDIPAFSVQFHPEAAPGPHDSRHLFERFRELMVRA